MLPSARDIPLPFLPKISDIVFSEYLKAMQKHSESHGHVTLGDMTASTSDQKTPAAKKPQDEVRHHIKVKQDGTTIFVLEDNI